MKKLVFLFLAGMVLWAIGCQKDSLLLDEQSPTDKVLTPRIEQNEIEAAIDKGVAWLLSTQNPDDGYFYSTSEGVARTALAVTKLCDRSLEIETPYNPDDPAGPYYTAIQGGLNYIFSQVIFSDPYYYLGSSYHQIYNTGIGMMAIAAYRCPDCTISVGPAAGKTHKQLMDDLVVYMDATQTPNYGPGGGWQYGLGSCCADNSNTGFAALGLLAAKEYGCDIPQAMLNELSPWLDYIQEDGTGGSGYQYPDNWVNIMKTGNLLFEFGLCGDLPDATRVQDALGYIAAHWDDVASNPVSTTQTGWYPSNYLAMYCLMKGFVSMGIESIEVEGVERDWFDEIATQLFNTQNGDGTWTDPAPWLDTYTKTAFSLLTLEKISPVSILEVGFDIKPGSCPNPINRGSKGLVPMAVLGSDDFDVTQIDPATVNIGGISPVKFHFEDVSTPFEGDLEDKNDCNIDGPDGYMDFFFHMDAEQLATLLVGYVKGDVVVLEVEGQLIDGPAFHGADIIFIVK